MERLSLDRHAASCVDAYAEYVYHQMFGDSCTRHGFFHRDS